MFSPDVQRIVDTMHDHASMDPTGSLLNKSGLTAHDLDEISRVMAALREWKTEETRQSKISSEYMKLGEREMQALRFIIAGSRINHLVTPVMVGEYLGLTSAGITKLIDRLQKAGHLERSPHPRDRRAIVLTVTPHTRQSARSQVGVLHARRFAAAARLTSAQRQTVIGFLHDLATPPPPTEPGAASPERTE